MILDRIFLFILVLIVAFFLKQADDLQDLFIMLQKTVFYFLIWNILISSFLRAVSSIFILTKKISMLWIKTLHYHFSIPLMNIMCSRFWCISIINMHLLGSFLKLGLRVFKKSGPDFVEVLTLIEVPRSCKLSASLKWIRPIIFNC